MYKSQKRMKSNFVSGLLSPDEKRSFCFFGTKSFFLRVRVLCVVCCWLLRGVAAISVMRKNKSGRSYSASQKRRKAFNTSFFLRSLVFFDSTKTIFVSTLKQKFDNFGKNARKAKKGVHTFSLLSMRTNGAGENYFNTR